MFVPDYANVLVKVVAIFGAINPVCLQLNLHTTFFLLRSCAHLNSLGKFGFQA